MHLKSIYQLIKSDVLWQWRNKSMASSWLLYVLVSVFVFYLSFQGKLPPMMWISLFWIIVIFSSLNSSLSLFGKEYGNSFFYLKSIVTPAQLFTSKLIVNIFYTWIIIAITTMAFSLFFGFIFPDNFLPFLAWALLGGLALSSLFTFSSSLASNTGNIVLLAVLAIPLLLPLLVILIRTGIMLISREPNLYQQWVILFVLNIVILLLSYIMFHYIWRE